ncbi:MAG: lantibiotic dehydratase family protein [Acidobacteriia bacterium]|nr:lantibiotic dehydratase family protein [Terriglobia bacterium]
MPGPSHALPPHLEILVPFEWGIWRWFVLRGAGFPAERIEGLAPACAAAADALILAEERVQSLFQNAIRTLNKTMDELRRQGEDRYSAMFKTVLNARRRLAEGKIPRTEDFFPEIQRMFHEISDAMQACERLNAEWVQSFEQSLSAQTETLRQFACDPKFQEAVVWQNRQAFETALQSVAREHGGVLRNQRQRNHEELVANYAQRYCVKNDTIGFFGPVAWGRIESGSRVIELSYGPSLTKRRQTYFENWAIDKVAAGISQLKGMDWWISPRLIPDAFIEKGMLQRPGFSPVALSELEQAILSRCNGKVLPQEILHAIHADPRLCDCSQQDLRAVLKAKADEGVLVWRFLVPVEVNSEIALREQLLRVGDPELRTTALNHLDKIEAARREVEGTAGDPNRLNRAMRNVEFVFEEITNVQGNRNPGTTYGGRTVVYEDCQRDLGIRIAPDLLSPIAPALSLLLKSLRWFMQSTALEFQRLFVQTYRELAVAQSSSGVRLQDWWNYTEPKLLNASSLDEVEKLFRQKWDEILAIGQQDSMVQLKSDDLKEKVEQLFPELGAGYYPVRYFCPDLMLAAEDEEAASRGELLYVLGEVHAGKNTLCHAALVKQHPNRHELVEATQWDLASSCFKILNTHANPFTTVRTSEGVLRPADYFLATTPDAIAPSGHDSHPISGLVLTEHDETIEVVSVADGRRFHILEAFSDLLFAFVMNKASWIPPLRHAPRVLIDKLVIHRETWRFRNGDLDFAAEKDEGKRFLEARRWMKSHSLPRKLFVKSALEVKPFYVDMESPVLVEILCRAIRRMNSSSGEGEEIIFSEMLPGSQQLWLRDAKGSSYTSELRFAVVDLKARSLSAIGQKHAGFDPPLFSGC